MTQNKNKAPVEACTFMTQVKFADKDGKQNRFEITGYDGGIIKDDWYWGNLAIDLAGVNFDKKITPVFESHDLGKRRGVADIQSKEGKISFGGYFMNSKAAQQLRKDMIEGFPMEASLYIPPSRVEYIEDGSKAEVNGKVIHGPGTVFRECVVKEISFCPFGRMTNTKTKAFADGDECCNFITICGKENKMSSDDKMTAELFAANHPEIHTQVAAKFKAEGKAESEKALKDRIDQFGDQFGDDPGFCLQLLKDGVSFADAVKKQAEKIKKEKDEFAEKQKETAEAASTTGKIPAANSEFSDDKPAKTKEQLSQDKFDEETATKEQLADHWSKDTNLKAEFASADLYCAYVVGMRNHA